MNIKSIPLVAYEQVSSSSERIILYAVLVCGSYNGTDLLRAVGINYQRRNPAYLKRGILAHVLVFAVMYITFGYTADKSFCIHAQAPLRNLSKIYAHILLQSAVELLGGVVA